MNNCPRILLSLSLAAAVAGGLAGTGRGPVAEPGRQGDRSAGRQQAPAGVEHQVEVLRRRSAAKVAVVRQMLDGHLTLPAAAAWFKVLNETPSDCPDRGPDPYPGVSEGESLCRQVICYVDSALREQSRSQAEAMTRKLEEELRAHLGRDGTVRLPEEGEGEPQANPGSPATGGRPR